MDGPYKTDDRSEQRTFDQMSDRFTASLRFASGWRDNYFGAAYATRIKAAIAFLKQEIAAAEAHPEIGAAE